MFEDVEVAKKRRPVEEMGVIEERQKMRPDSALPLLLSVLRFGLPLLLYFLGRKEELARHEGRLLLLVLFRSRVGPLQRREKGKRKRRRAFESRCLSILPSLGTLVCTGRERADAPLLFCFFILLFFKKAETKDKGASFFQVSFQSATIALSSSF